MPTPPTAEQNQKKRTFDVLPKPDKFIRYRQRLSVGPGLNVGKAVMAGLVPAIHAAPRQILSPAQTSVSSGAYDEAAVFSWMAGVKPGHDGEAESQPNPRLTL